MRMWPRARKHQSDPALEGRYYKFVLEQPPAGFDVLSPHAAPDGSRAPYVLMHMRQRGGQTRVAVPVPDTAKDVADTPTDALPPTGAAGAASEITPAELSEEATAKVTETLGKLVFGGPNVSWAATNSGTPSLKKDSCSVCSHCGKGAKKKETFQRCSVCKETWYCGAECQRAGWKKHKKTCERPLSMGDLQKKANAKTKDLQVLFDKVDAAHEGHDWLEVLKCEGRLDELMAEQSDEHRDYLLRVFSDAHSRSGAMKGCIAPAVEMVRLQRRRLAGLVKLERFRDYGDALCYIGDGLLASKCTCDSSLREEAAGFFHKALDVAQSHGIFSVECLAGAGLGDLAMLDGRDEEGVELLRNALLGLPTPGCSRASQTRYRSTIPTTLVILSAST